jgi:glycosyltransferase involved in cell wall biosynthesis
VRLPTASIVLCTYQGERFLESQLKSLFGQTVRPVEIVGQDDGSTDGTFAILEKHVGLSPDISLRLFRNEKRLGFAANFALALSRAKGDVIFFCDQDDQWESRKLETILRAFALDPDLSLAFSDAAFIDEKGEPLPGLMLARNGLVQGEIQEWRTGNAFSFLVKRNPVAGMCMAIRSSLVPLVLPLPGGWEHDYWALALTAGLGKKILCEPTPLVQYRQHQGQVIGGSNGLLYRWHRVAGQPLPTRAKEAEKWALLALRLRQNGAPSPAVEKAEAKRDWLLRRSCFPHSRVLRLLPIAMEWMKGSYRRFDAGLSSALKDWLAPF